MNIRCPSLLLCLLFLFATAGLSGCSSKKTVKEETPNIKEGFGKTVDPYDTKNGRIGVPPAKPAGNPR